MLYRCVQVSTWFANARRRLKKENRLQWSATPGGSEPDRKQCDDIDDVSDDVSSDCNYVTDYDLLPVPADDCRPDATVDRRQAVPRPFDIASRLGNSVVSVINKITTYIPHVISLRIVTHIVLKLEKVKAR